ncbi:MAG: hypothetical protein E7311_04640 [Clostridiales bacterium]|nr:hypothetical protein [Clostridiales bacterium]
MKKGVSIITLAVYIIGFLAIIGILIAFNVNVLNKTNDFVAKNTLNTEYIKFNMFFTALIKENNYIKRDFDENSNEIIKIMNYDRALETEYATDEETGEQYISAKYWENTEGNQIGYIVYDSEKACIYYIEYDNEASAYNTETPMLISDYVSSANFNIGADNQNITVDLEYEANDVTFSPNNITYIMGRGY